MNKPITTLCITIDLEKQMVLRASRLIRVRKVKCFRPIFWVYRLPTVETPVRCAAHKLPTIAVELHDAKWL